MSEDQRERPGLLLWLLPAFAIGVLLRLWNLGDQIVGGDELHAVRRALSLPVSELLVTYHASDNCLPLSAFYRLWMDSGRALTELVLRLPVLLSGIALLALTPCAIARALGPRIAVLATWLVAISPLLVHYSRMVRSYMPAVALSWIALAAFVVWWRKGRRGAAAVYICAAPLAVYFHPLVVPFVLAPAGFAVADLVIRRKLQGRPTLLNLLGVGLAVFAGLAAFLVPAWPSLAALVQDKAGAGSFESPRVDGVLQLFAGSGAPVAVLFWFTALIGAASLWRRDVGLVLLGLLLIAAQIAGIAILEPTLVERSLVLTRYLLVLLPLGLLWCAVGLDAMLRAVESRIGRRAAMAAGAALVLGLAASGPLTERALRSTSFSNHNDFVEFTAARPTLIEGDLPDFYREELPPGAFIEVPWPTSWWMGRTAHLYQRVHGRRVLVTPNEAVLRDPRLAFRNYVNDLDQAERSGARFLIVHRDLLAEERGLPVAAVPPDRIPAGVEKRLRTLAGELGRAATARYGEPFFRDSQLRVWDLTAGMQD